LCGHVGIAGDLELHDESVMKRLLLFDYFRGPDSTGFATVSKNGQMAKVVKIASHPLDLFDSQRFKTALNYAVSSAFIGHNRASTRGATNAVNAHPFEYGDIVGAHNGTLDYSSHKALEEALDEKFDVDSQAIFAAIDRLGIENTVPLLQGAWALVWVDMKDGSLNFLRNKERPFWYAFSEDNKKILWASEWPTIQSALKLSGKEYPLSRDDKNFCYFSTPTDVHIKYDLPSLKEGNKPNPVLQTLKGKEAPVVSHVAAPFQRTGSGRTPQYSTTSKTTTGGPTTTKVVNILGNRESPFAGYITKEEFRKMSPYGCAWCGEEVEFEVPGCTLMEAMDIVICPSCSCNDGATRAYLSDMESVAAYM
jgi:predicted glutamine amidotransferase